LAESTLTVHENLEAPYVVKNESGMFLTIRLGDEFMVRKPFPPPLPIVHGYLD